MKLETRILRKAADLGLEPFQVEELLVRGMLVPKQGHRFAIADINAIEARMAAYLSGDPNLEAFRRGEDIYCTFASKLFGHEVTKAAHPDKRSVGKVAELSAQYGVGGPKFTAMAAKQGVRLADVGLTGWEVVHAWRDAHPALAGTWDGGMYRDYRIYKGGMWRTLHATAKAVAQGSGPQEIGVLRFEMVGPDLHVVLPSGVRLTYPDARIEEVTQEFDGEVSTKMEFVFTKAVTKGRVQRVQMYPGKWMENITQWACWTILNDVQVEMEEHGLPVVLTVHDELLLEAPEKEAPDALRFLLDRMKKSPDWCPDLPLKAEGFIGTYYTKDPRSDWVVMK